jgi:hypothetical protein
VLTRRRDEALFERVFDLDTDAYLDAHVVNGYPTLPGTFVTRGRRRGGQVPLPDMHVVGLEDARFHHFLRVYESDRPSPKRVEAKVIEKDDEHAAVRVRILTDVVAPNGTVLQRDKLHTRSPRSWRASTRPRRRGTRGRPTARSPCLTRTTSRRAGAADGPARLDDGHALEPLGKRATYSSGIAADDPAFSRFVVPSVMLDGLARRGGARVRGRALHPARGAVEHPPNRSLRARQRPELARRYDRIDLYVTPKQMTLEDPSRAESVRRVRPTGG